MYQKLKKVLKSAMLSSLHKLEDKKSFTIFNFQKQLTEVFYKKRCSYKFHKIHRKTPAAESLF